MSSFVSQEWRCKNVHNQDEPRGGSTSIQVGDCILTFGGVDREQHHYNDLIISRPPAEGQSSEMKKYSAPVWQKADGSGDIPTSRTGHSFTAYGEKYALLCGGLDYAEEVAYNDLYILNTETLEWKYVGEAGVEMKARNSHSMCVLTKQTASGVILRYLVVYGGASPEEGPLGDTLYAVLPDPNTIDINEFFVTWKELKSSPPPAPAAATVTASGPGEREMHATCLANSGEELLVIGGRNSSGEILDDVWVLSINPKNSPSNPDPKAADGVSTYSLGLEESGGSLGSTTVDEPELIWTLRADLRLPVGRCAHGAAVVGKEVCIFGGFTADGGIDGSLLACSISSSSSSSSSSSLGSDAGEREGGGAGGWSVRPLKTVAANSTKMGSKSGSTSKAAAAAAGAAASTTAVSSSLGARFGLSMCSVSERFTQRYYTGEENSLTVCADSGAIETTNGLTAIVGHSGSVGGGALIFGGVSVEVDFGDIWLLYPATKTVFNEREL